MECPVCNHNQNKEIYVRTQERIKKRVKAFICRRCKSIYLEDYQKDRGFLYENPDYSPWGKAEEEAEEDVAMSKKEAFKWQLSLLQRYTTGKGKRLLDIGTGKGYLLEVASELGFDPYGVEPSPYTSKVTEKRFPKKIICGLLEDAKYKNGEFDVITMTDLIEHIPHPHSFFDEVYRILKPSGFILITTPNSNSFTRILLGKDWFQYKYEHIIYYNKVSLRHLLDKKGIEVRETRNNIKRFQMGYYYHYFKQYSLFGIDTLFRFIYPYLPGFIKNLYFSNPITGEMIVIAQKL
ncbi:MAG: class I SAM-dependent methyltransferase [bacterium]